MKTQREIEIENIYEKSIWDMSMKEIIDNSLASDWVKIVEENAFEEYE